jgi:anaerobic selenocysteine-containing dehydrogenase
VVLMNVSDMAKAGLAEGDMVALVGDSGDNIERRVGGLRVVRYEVPEGCLGAYYPECNDLIPVAHHALESHVPAGKSVPVRLEVMR